MGDRYPYDLSREVLDELRGFYVERYVDNMDSKDLYNYVFDTMMYDVEKQTDREFLRDAMDYWDDHFDDIVKEVQEYTNRSNDDGSAITRMGCRKTYGTNPYARKQTYANGCFGILPTSLSRHDHKRLL